MYTFSTSSNQCQVITGIYQGFGHLMISQTKFFLLGVPTSSPGNLLMFKITFSATAVDWANQIVSSGNAWYSESRLSLDSQTIFSFFLYGTPSYNLFFAALSPSSGSATSTRYRSSITVAKIWGTALTGDYVVD